MEYKILIRLYAPEVEDDYELLIPINRTIGELSALFIKLIRIKHDNYPENTRIQIFNRRENTFYPPNELVRNTNIRNGTELVVISM